MDLQHGRFEATLLVLKRLTFLLLHGEEEVRASLRPFATLELSHELWVKFFEGMNQSQ